MNRIVLPKYCFSIVQVFVTSFTKLVQNDWVSVLLWGLSATRTTLCAAETVSHPHLQESHHVSRMEALCFCRQLWSSITNLGFLLACDLLQSFDYFVIVKISFDLDYTNKWSIAEPLSLFTGWASNPFQTKYKTSQELRKLPFTCYLESQV